MEKTLTITMNQIDGKIDYNSDGDPTYAESLGMIEYAKLLITNEWLKDIED